MKNNSRHIPLPLLLTFLTTMSTVLPVRSEGVPKVVVNILVDQLRSDYLNAFMPLYGEDGLKKLLSEGRVYQNAEYPMARTDAAVSAASVATGTTPSDHGIVAQRWLDRETLRPINCVSDANFTGINTQEKVSAARLSVSTIGDELKVATEGKSLVVSIAPSAECAILQAGHAADVVLWLDDVTAKWASSSYYGGVPAWVGVQNSQLSINAPSVTWTPSNSLVGNFSYFLSGGMKTPFKHQMKGQQRVTQFKTSGLVNEEVANAVGAAMQNSMLGNDNITDLVSVTLYAGNYEHATASVRPLEIQDIYVRLDRALAQIMQSVEKKVGQGNALYCLTSTGYADEETQNLSQYRIPSGTFDVSRAAGLLGMYLRAVYGQGNYIEATYGNELYLDHKLLEDKQINQTEMLERCQDFLMQLSGVKEVYGSVRLLQGAWTPGISRIRAGYNSQCSGDITIEVTPGWRCVNAESKTDRLQRESYVPFPIVFYGAGVEPAQLSMPVTVDYIAPTLSKALRIRAPNACSNAPLF